MADNPNPHPRSPFLSGLLRLLPLIALGASIVASATAAQIQINGNSKAIDDNKTAIGLRVPTFLYDKDMEDIEEEIAELAEAQETNEEVIDKVEDSTTQIESQIELEVERLRNQIERTEREQAIKLDNILRILESQPAAASRSTLDN